jgi:hypothetical protein
MFKNKTTILLLIAFFQLTLISCSNEGDGKTYLIKMRLNPGDTFSSNRASDIIMSTEMGGKPMVMKIQTNTGTFNEVLDSTAAGNRLKMTYTKSEQKMDMGIGRYDTSMNAKSKYLIGRSVIITLNGNIITDVEGFQSLVTDTTNTQAMEYVKSMTSKENIESMYRMMFSMYPNRAVEIGESWTAESALNIMDLNLMIKTEYTLKDVDKNIAEIVINGTISTQGTAMNNKVKMDMTGNQKGKMYVDLSDGYITKENHEMKMEGDIISEAGKLPFKMSMQETVSEN